MCESMIERVARAMVAQDSGPEGSILFDIHWREFGAGYLSSARAAIEAMREPTDAMVDAYDNMDVWDDDTTEPTAQQSLSAMIVAALNERAAR